MIQNIDWNKLLNFNSEWGHLLCCQEKKIDEVISGLFRDDLSVARIIRGQRCLNKERLFQEWASALQFPDYFGHNWDAFDECLGDLEWLPGTSYNFFITNIDRVLENSIDEFKIFVEILKNSAIEWKALPKGTNPQKTSPISFHVLFHCEINKKTFTQEKFKKTGILLNSVDLE